MRFHRSAFVLPALAALVVGCTSESAVNTGDPAKEAAEVQAGAPAAVKSGKKPTKPPGPKVQGGSELKPDANL